MGLNVYQGSGDPRPFTGDDDTQRRFEAIFQKHQRLTQEVADWNAKQGATLSGMQANIDTGKVRTVGTRDVVIQFPDSQIISGERDIVVDATSALTEWNTSISFEIPFLSAASAIITPRAGSDDGTVQAEVAFISNTTLNVRLTCPVPQKAMGFCFQVCGRT